MFPTTVYLIVYNFCVRCIHDANDILTTVSVTGSKYVSPLIPTRISPTAHCTL